MASKAAELSARIIMRLEPGVYTCDIPTPEDYARDIARIIDSHRADARREALREAAALIEENSAGTSWVTQRILWNQADEIMELAAHDLKGTL